MFVLAGSTRTLFQTPMDRKTDLRKMLVGLHRVDFGRRPRVREPSANHPPNSRPNSPARFCAATKASSNFAFIPEASIDVMAA